MANLALFIKPYSSNSLSIWYKYLKEDIKGYRDRNYHKIDLNFEKTFIIENNTLIAKIGLQNLLNTKYRYFDFDNREVLANGRNLWLGLTYEF